MAQTQEPDKSVETIAAKLKAEGFLKLPPLWIRREEMDEILAITSRSCDAVNDIRRSMADIVAARSAAAATIKAKPKNQTFIVEKRKKISVSVPTRDPRIDKDAAWEAFQKAR